RPSADQRPHPSEAQGGVSGASVAPPADSPGIRSRGARIFSPSAVPPHTQKEEAMTEQTDHPPIPRVQVARYLAHELAMAFDELPEDEEYLSDEAAEAAIAALQLMLDSLRALDRL